MLPQMLRCLVFLLSDFSRVGLGRRGEVKKSAVLGVTSRTVRLTTGGGRWGGDDQQRWARLGCGRFTWTGGNSATLISVPKRD